MPAQTGVRFEENPVILSEQLLVSAVGKNCDMLPFLRRTVYRIVIFKVNEANIR